MQNINGNCWSMWQSNYVYNQSLQYLVKNYDLRTKQNNNLINAI